MMPKVKTLLDPVSRKIRARCDIHGEFELSDQTQDALRETEGMLRGSAKAGFFRPNCPQCKDKQERVEQEARNMTEMSHQRKTCNLPRRFHDKTLESWQVSGENTGKVKGMAERYVEEYKTNKELGVCLIFAGPPGTGKTHLAAAIMNGVIGQGFTATYTTGLDMKASVQATYRDQGASQSRAQAIKSFIGPGLLVIDEIDLLHASEDSQLILWEVISGRYNDGDKPTLIISNLNRQELTAQLGGRIIDRLREGGGQFVVFNWSSRRR